MPAPDQDSEGPNFLVLVLVMFAVILAIVAYFAWLGPDGGANPFEYEGF